MALSDQDFVRDYNNRMGIGRFRRDHQPHRGDIWRAAGAIFGLVGNLWGIAAMVLGWSLLGPWMALSLATLTYGLACRP